MRIPFRLVIDTNVVLDLFHFDRPSTRALMPLIEQRDALCFACPATVEELGHVITRPEFGRDEAAAAQVISRYRQLALCVTDPPATPVLPQCRDASDQKFLLLAWSVSADLLVTRDKALLKLARRVAKLSRLRIGTPELTLPLLNVQR